MLRRVPTLCALHRRAGVTAMAVAGGLSASASLFAHQASPLQQVRWASSDAAAPASNSAQRSSNRTSIVQGQRGRRDAMPPAFDIVHWNDEDITAGHLLRVAHRDGFIVLDYHRQRCTTTELREDGSRAASPNRAERVVTVTLPPVYVARFLGVLEGRMSKLEVQSRYTNASFAPNTAKGKHHYTLHCTSMKPTTGQIQTVDGADVHEETVEWTVEFDAAESLMLHRFLTQALHFNTGFSRHG
nr:26 kDa guide RNA binding protein [Leishmania tarentolae]